MSFRLKVFVFGSFIISVLVVSIFLFIPKHKTSQVIEAPITQTR